METLLVVLVLAAAVLWAALRIRRAVRGARVAAPACPGCTACGEGPASRVPAGCREAKGAGRRGPPR